uniref:Uncharacterized protein n=1 Tax=Arion vulgaris TaxID=1028688 RepID=A0A0B7AGP0_9EUPU
MKTALTWIPEGKGKRGRLKPTYRKTIEQKLKDINHNWNIIQSTVKNREE